MTDLGEWLAGRSAILSVDVDYFLSGDEAGLAADLGDRVEALLRAGVGLSDDHHVALANMPGFPVDVAINFDFHMDISVEYLFGGAPRAHPCNATVFEHLLSSRRIDRYIWALPELRYKQVADIYGKAWLRNAQPRLSDIHCLTGRVVLDTLVPLVDVKHIFVCRSPDYGTPFTDALFDRLVRPGVGGSPDVAA